MNVVDWIVFDAGPYLLAVWTVVLVFFACVAIRAEWKRAHIVSTARIDAVREWAGDYRIYVPADWDTPERTR
jgi:hypothetical protein